MTDSAVTDGDLRNARLWAEKVGPPSVSPGYIGTPSEIHSAARVILATVDAPALSEELVRIAEGWEEWATCAINEALAAATTRAKQMEHDLAEARAEVERLTDVNETLRRADNFKEFRERLADVQKGAESNAESPDPADVKPGEAWIVDVGGEKRNAVKDADNNYPWNTVTGGGWMSPVSNKEVTLLARLVPAPRAITNPGDLDTLPIRTIIRDSRGETFERAEDGWGRISIPVKVIRVPVTVLWEPGA